MRRTSLLIAVLVALSACSSNVRPAGSSATTSSHVSASPSASSSSTPAASPPSAFSSHAPATAASTATPPPGAKVPPPGRYVFSQTGSETFCSAQACSSPRPLPATMESIVTYEGRDDAGDRVTTQMQIAPGRVLRLFNVFTAESEMLERLDVTFTESGVTQTQTLEPSPAIRMLSLPLRTGRSWNGRFTEGSSNGEYTFTAKGLESIRSRGKATKAWRVEGLIRVTGETTATITMTSWLDPATFAIEQLSASIDATYQITRYRAQFSDILQSGP